MQAVVTPGNVERRTPNAEPEPRTELEHELRREN